jgi:hypothetical protein
LLQFKLSLAPFVFLLLDFLLALQLLDPILMLAFPLLGRLLNASHFCGFALLLPLFSNAPVAVVYLSVANQCKCR